MSWQTPENLSADGIAALFGFGSAATMQAALEAAEDEAAKAGWTNVRLDKTVDQALSTTSTLCTWTTSTLVGATISSNEITLEQAGDYKIHWSVQCASVSPIYTPVFCMIEDWTSGSSVLLQIRIKNFGSQPCLSIDWEGTLPANTKIRFYTQIDSGGSGYIDADGLIAGYPAGSLARSNYCTIRRVA